MGLFCQNLKGQYVFKIDTADVRCKEQIKKAENDFENNSFVLRINKPIPYSDTYKKVLEGYNVTVEFTGIFIADCYGYTIKSLLNSKYQTDFLAMAKKVADSIDEHGSWNREARLKIEEHDLVEYIQKHVSKKENKTLTRKYGNETLWLALVVDTIGKSWIYSLGRLEEVDVMHSLRRNADNISKVKEPIIQNLIHGKELFIPKMKHGEAIESWMILQLNFGE